MIEGPVIDMLKSAGCDQEQNGVWFRDKDDLAIFLVPINESGNHIKIDAIIGKMTITTYFQPVSGPNDPLICDYLADFLLVPHKEKK